MKREVRYFLEGEAKQRGFRFHQDKDTGKFSWSIEDKEHGEQSSKAFASIESCIQSAIASGFVEDSGLIENDWKLTEWARDLAEEAKEAADDMNSRVDDIMHEVVDQAVSCLSTRGVLSIASNCDIDEGWRQGCDLGISEKPNPIDGLILAIYCELESRITEYLGEQEEHTELMSPEEICCVAGIYAEIDEDGEEREGARRIKIRNGAKFPSFKDDSSDAWRFITNEWGEGNDLEQIMRGE